MKSFGKMSVPICFDCANATPVHCVWLDRGDKRDLIYYESRYIKTTNGKFKNSKYIELVSVQECYNFEKGPLKTAVKADSPVPSDAYNV